MREQDTTELGAVTRRRDSHGSLTGANGAARGCTRRARPGEVNATGEVAGGRTAVLRASQRRCEREKNEGRQYPSERHGRDLTTIITPNPHFYVTCRSPASILGAAETAMLMTRMRTLLLVALEKFADSADR
jgi:hypothetical protein